MLRARGAEHIFLSRHALRSRYRNPNRSERFFVGAAGWPGNARGGYGEICLQTFAAAKCHFARRLFAAGAIRFQCLAANSQQVHFQFIEVTHNATFVVLRCARHFGDAVCERAAGATFGSCQSLLALQQQSPDNRCKSVVVVAINLFRNLREQFVQLAIQ